MLITEILSQDQLLQLIQQSNNQPVVIFKTNPGCNTGRVAGLNLQQSLLQTNINLYRIDVIQQRPIAQKFTELTGYPHKSPQILIIRNGKAVFEQSHGMINGAAIISFLSTFK